MSLQRLLGIGAAAILGIAAATSAALPAQAAPAEPATSSSYHQPSTPPVLGATPYQGWNTYFGLGGDFTTDKVIEVADFLNSSGLAKAGYNIVWLDGGWQAETPRGADGQLQGDAARFPGGMKAVADAIHARGLKAGIYTDAGPFMPEHCGLGSYGHYQTDADTIAAWGYDAVKVDFLCGIAADLDPQTVYTEFATALRNNASGRDIILNICNPVTSPDWGNYPESQQSTHTWSYAPAIAQSWRTYTDVGFVGKITYRDVLRNFDANAAHPEVAGPGHFNDPDYLGPQLGLSDEEFRSQMALWSLAAAPLVIGSDPRTFTPETLATLTNKDLLAINQDRLGKQATRVGAAGNTETWVKPLADGSVAVGLVNRTDTPVSISTTTSAVGLSSNRVTVKDAWTHTTTEANGTLRASVPARGVAVLVVKKATGLPQSARVVADAPTITALNGQPVPASGDVLTSASATLTGTVTLHNDGTIPVVSPQVSFTAPNGWSASVVGSQPALIKAGKSVDVKVKFVVPADASNGSVSLGTSVRYIGVRGKTTANAPALSVTVAPAPPTGTDQPLSAHPWISATSGWLTPSVDTSVGGGSPLKIAGTTYPTGLGVASPSDIRYYLGGTATRLTGVVGVDDVVNNVGPDGGTVTFSLIADGQTIWDSGTVTRGHAIPFDVSLTGVRDLTLHVGDAGDGGYNDRADWANLKISAH